MLDDLQYMKNLDLEPIRVFSVFPILDGMTDLAQKGTVSILILVSNKLDRGDLGNLIHQDSFDGILDVARGKRASIAGPQKFDIERAICLVIVVDFDIPAFALHIGTDLIERVLDSVFECFHGVFLFVRL